LITLKKEEARADILLLNGQIELMGFLTEDLKKEWVHIAYSPLTRFKEFLKIALPQILATWVSQAH